MRIFLSIVYLYCWQVAWFFGTAWSDYLQEDCEWALAEEGRLHFESRYNADFIHVSGCILRLSNSPVLESRLAWLAIWTVPRWPPWNVAAQCYSYSYSHCHFLGYGAKGEIMGKVCQVSVILTPIALLQAVTGPLNSVHRDTTFEATTRHQIEWLRAAFIKRQPLSGNIYEPKWGVGRPNTVYYTFESEGTVLHWLI